MIFDEQNELSLGSWMEDLVLLHMAYLCMYLCIYHMFTRINVKLITLQVNMWVFKIIVFIAITFPFFFFKKTLLKLSLSLESKYNKLQFGKGISSIEASKQKLRIFTSCHVYNKVRWDPVCRDDETIINVGKVNFYCCSLWKARTGYINSWHIGG